VAFNVAIRYISVRREETWSRGPKGPDTILAGRDCPPVGCCWAIAKEWISRLSMGDKELRRRSRRPLMVGGRTCWYGGDVSVGLGGESGERD
jgi:hypothetical protein